MSNLDYLKTILDILTTKVEREGQVCVIFSHLLDRCIHLLELYITESQGG